MTSWSFVLQKLEEYAFRKLLDVLALRHDVKELHGVIDAHPLELQRLVHVAQIE